MKEVIEKQNQKVSSFRAIHSSYVEISKFVTEPQSLILMDLGKNNNKKSELMN